MTVLLLWKAGKLLRMAHPTSCDTKLAENSPQCFTRRFKAMHLIICQMKNFECDGSRAVWQYGTIVKYWWTHGTPNRRQTIHQGQIKTVFITSFMLCTLFTRVWNSLYQSIFFCVLKICHNLILNLVKVPDVYFYSLLC